MFTKSRRATILTLALTCLGFILLSYWANWNSSIIVDEVAHIPSGFYDLTSGTMALNSEHPPLMKDISAIPLILTGAKQQAPPDIPGGATQWTWGGEFLQFAGNNIFDVTRLARLAVTIANGLMLFGLGVCIWSVWSRRTAVLATGLLALSPFMLGYGSLVITDVGVALLQAAAILLTIKAILVMSAKSPPSKSKWFLSRQTWYWAIAAGLVSGLALMAKFSAVWLVIYIPLAAIGLAVWLRDKANYRRLAAIVGIILVVAFLFVTVYEDWHVRNMTEATVKRQIGTSQSFIVYDFKFIYSLADTPATRGIAEYIHGLTAVDDRLEGGNPSVYFEGQNYIGRNTSWAYFPVLLLAKQPLAIPALALGSILLLAWYHHQKRWKIKAAELQNMLKPYYLAGGLALSFLAIAIFSAFQIGVRHTSMVLVIESILTAAIAIYALEQEKRWRWAIIASLIAVAISCAVSFPYYISYYNIAAGGVKNGWKVADDSNYDWGQDILRLDQWGQKQGIPAMYIYGLLPDIDYQPYTTTQMLVSADDLSNFQTDANVPYLAVTTTAYVLQPQLYNQYQFVAQATPSIFVFRKN